MQRAIRKVKINRPNIIDGTLVRQYHTAGHYTVEEKLEISKETV